MSSFSGPRPHSPELHRVNVVEFDLDWHAGRPKDMRESDIALILRSELMPDLETVLAQAQARHGDISASDIELDLGRFSDFDELSEFRRDFRAQLAQRLDELAGDRETSGLKAAPGSIFHSLTEVEGQIQRLVCAGFETHSTPTHQWSDVSTGEARDIANLLSRGAVEALVQRGAKSESGGPSRGPKTPSLRKRPDMGGDEPAEGTTITTGVAAQGRGLGTAQDAAAILADPANVWALTAELATQTWRMGVDPWPPSGSAQAVADRGPDHSADPVQAWAAALNAVLSPVSTDDLRHIWRVNSERAVEIIETLPAHENLRHSMAILDGAQVQSMPAPVLKTLRADLTELQNMFTETQLSGRSTEPLDQSVLPEVTRLLDRLQAALTGRAHGGTVVHGGRVLPGADAGAPSDPAGQGGQLERPDPASRVEGRGQRVDPPPTGAATEKGMPPADLTSSEQNLDAAHGLMSGFVSRVLEAVTMISPGGFDAISRDGVMPEAAGLAARITELRSLFPDAKGDPPVVKAVLKALDTAAAPDHFLTEVIAAIRAGHVVDIDVILASHPPPTSDDRAARIAELRSLFPDGKGDPPVVEAALKALGTAAAPDHFLTEVIAAIRAGQTVDIDALAAQTGERPPAQNALLDITGLLDGAGRPSDPDLPLALRRYPTQIAGLLTNPTTGPARSARLAGLLSRAQLEWFLNAAWPTTPSNELAALDVLEQVLVTGTADRNRLGWFRLLRAFGHLPPTGGTTGLTQQTLVFLSGNAHAARTLARDLAGRLSDPKTAPKSPATPSVAQAVAQIARAPQDSPADPDEVELTQTSGLTLLNPFLPRLFAELELTQDGAFAGPIAQMKAVCLLNYAALGHAEGQGRPMPLERLLCGVPAGAEIRPQEINAQDAELVQSMLTAFIGHWPALKNTTPDGLREAFLMRGGILSDQDGARNLKVEHKTLDILLEKLPWPISVIKFGWMPEPLHVDWRRGHDG